MHRRVTEHTWIKVARQQAMLDQKCRCLYCFEHLAAATATAEHRKARSKGGSNSRENIGATCEPCNSLKGSMGEKAFIKLIKSPPRGSAIRLWLAWSRRRINLAALRACRNIALAAGIPFEDF